MSSQAGGAIWTIQCDKGVPSSLAVSAEVLELTRRQYGGVSFKEELEVVSAQAEREEQQQSGTTPRSHSDGALNLNEGAGSVTAATKVAAASSAVATAEAKQREDAFAKDAVVTAMVQQTLQSRDECLFYLESCNWDLDRATQMLREFTERN
jgi:hypothetical protein